MKVNDHYVVDKPDAAAPFAIFPDAWSSRVPVDGATTGGAELFNDIRIKWLLEQLGSIKDWAVLELGPLECGHSAMLDAAGAGVITAIEANTICYMKCLIVKEALGLSKVRLLLGDFDRFVDHSDRTFDLIVASGVLYHLTDPLITLINLMKLSKRIFIWSHFFDDKAMPTGDPRREAFSGQSRVAEAHGHKLTYYERSYGGHSHPATFCGGIFEGSIWLDIDEVKSLFSQHGFAVTTAFEHPGHPNGPSACLLALKA